MAQTLFTDQLVEEARKRTGLDQFDAETFREGLDIFLSDFGRQELPESASNGPRKLSSRRSPRD